MFQLNKFKITALTIFISLVFILLKINQAEAKSFNLYLYFDPVKNEISQDRDAAKKIDLIYEPYLAEQTADKKASDYYFKIKSYGGYTSDTIYFQPQNGSFILPTPYVPENYQIDIYHKDTLQLSIDVSQFATCNANNVCESSKGENAQNCIADCFSQEVAKIKNKSYNNINNSNNQNLEPSDPLTGAKKDEVASQNTTETKTPFFGLIVGLFMILGGIGYGVYWFIKQRRQE